MLGKYCEKLDPSLAFLAYKRAGGECDDDLLRVTSENGLFKNQARYLVEKQDMDLWAKVRLRVFVSSRFFFSGLVVMVVDLPELSPFQVQGTTFPQFVRQSNSSCGGPSLYRALFSSRNVSEQPQRRFYDLMSAVSRQKTQITPRCVN